jgi:hypothetical protein
MKLTSTPYVPHAPPISLFNQQNFHNKTFYFLVCWFWAQ